MNYLLKNNREKRKAAFPMYVLLGFTVVVVVVTFISPSFFPELFSTIAAPFWKGEHGLSAGASNALTSKRELLKENEALRETISKLYNQSLTYKLLQEENTELKAILGRVGERKVILATVLRKPPFSPYDVLVIDVGEKEGVSVGDEVVVEGDISIGNIAEVNGGTSKVKIYSSPGEKHNVLIGTTSIQASATGRGGGNFEIILPRDADVKVGDSVTIPGITPTLFGTVSALLGDPARPFETVLFKSPINISELKKVQVVKY